VAQKKIKKSSEKSRVQGVLKISEKATNIQVKDLQKARGTNPKDHLQDYKKAWLLGSKM